MTGIAELFAEYDGSDVDWFQMQFYFERLAENRQATNRKAQQRYALRRKLSVALCPRPASKRRVIRTKRAARRRASARQYRDANREATRALARVNSAAYRARKRMETT